jgi:hypothetical protein
VREYTIGICGGGRVLFFETTGKPLPSLIEAEVCAETLARALGGANPTLCGCEVAVYDNEGRNLLRFPIWNPLLERKPPRMGLPKSLAYFDPRTRAG